MDRCQRSHLFKVRVVAAAVAVVAPLRLVRPPALVVVVAVEVAEMLEVVEVPLRLAKSRLPEVEAAHLLSRWLRHKIR